MGPKTRKAGRLPPLKIGILNLRSINNHELLLEACSGAHLFDPRGRPAGVEKSLAHASLNVWRGCETRLKRQVVSWKKIFSIPPNRTHAARCLLQPPGCVHRRLTFNDYQPFSGNPCCVRFPVGGLHPQIESLSSKKGGSSVFFFKINVSHLIYNRLPKNVKNCDF